LFPGIMVTAQGLKVIELNVRFGDPETQAFVRLLETDLLDLIDECVDGGIGTHTPIWSTNGAVGVVLASGGYPDDYTIGHVISGIPEAGRIENVVIFHAGTTQTDALKTNGGRVLTVCATGSPLGMARDLAYRAVEKIGFEGKYFRRDIGDKSHL
jgi:phosphoribosylamine---glycine ligase